MCQNGLEFRNCGPLVPPSCADIDGRGDVCGVGCFCPDDLVFNDNGECIPAEGCNGNKLPLCMCIYTYTHK